MARDKVEGDKLLYLECIPRVIFDGFLKFDGQAKWVRRGVKECRSKKRRNVGMLLNRTVCVTCRGVRRRYLSWVVGQKSAQDRERGRGEY